MKSTQIETETRAKLGLRTSLKNLIVFNVYIVSVFLKGSYKICSLLKLYCRLFTLFTVIKKFCSLIAASVLLKFNWLKFNSNQTIY